MSTTFPRVKRGQLGYDVEQVEDFLEDARRAYATAVHTPTALDSLTIRQTSFSMKKGGYAPTHVDAALDRLEEAFAKRERERAIAEKGEDAWYSSVHEQAAETLARLQRDDGARFDRVGGMTQGYRVADVDRFAARIAAYLQDGPEMTPSAVRQVQFPSQRGGYNEDQVDRVFDSVVTLMLAVR